MKDMVGVRIWKLRWRNPLVGPDGDKIMTLKRYNYGDLVYHALKVSKEFFERTEKHNLKVEEGME